MSTKTIRGTYGSGDTPCDVYVYTTSNGARWCVIDGSVNVFCTYDNMNDGVDCETTNDIDFFTWNKPIESEEELELAVTS